MMNLAALSSRTIHARTLVTRRAIESKIATRCRLQPTRRSYLDHCGGISALASSPLFPIPVSLIAKPTIPIQKTRNDAVETQILAFSSTIVPRTWIEQIQSLLRAAWRRLWESWIVASRCTEIALRLGPLVCTVPLTTLFPSLVDWSWEYLLHQIQALGPGFIKLAQWMATRRDIFPPLLCQRLAQLQDDGTPHSWRHTERTLNQAFGGDYSKRLQIKEDDIIGCGSAAQVYVGRFFTDIDNEKSSDRTSSWKKVAVKILHPNFAERVERDLLFLESISSLLHSLPLEVIKMMNLPRVVENFGVILERQADLRIEARNLQQFRANFYKRDDPSSSLLVFPKPYKATSQFLMEDLIEDATPMTQYVNHPDTKLRRQLANPLLRAFLKMVFLDNFVHCDLHAGNVLVQQQRAGERNKKNTIVFLDAGIATSLSKQDQQNLMDLFRAVLLNDGNRAGRLMVERAKYKRCTTEEDTNAFAQGVGAIVAEFHEARSKGLTLGTIRIGTLLSRVLDLCRIYGVEIDPAMANVVVSTLVLEGLGRSLDPDLNLIDFAIPFVLGRGRV